MMLKRLGTENNKVKKHCFLCGRTVKRVQKCGLSICKECCRKCRKEEPGRCKWKEARRR